MVERQSSGGAQLLSSAATIIAALVKMELFLHSPWFFSDWPVGKMKATEWMSTITRDDDNGSMQTAEFGKAIWARIMAKKQVCLLWVGINYRAKNYELTDWTYCLKCKQLDVMKIKLVNNLVSNKKKLFWWQTENIWGLTETQK